MNRTCHEGPHWLLSRKWVKAARPVTVQIGRRFYPAARYSEVHKGVLIKSGFTSSAKCHHYKID